MHIPDGFLDVTTATITYLLAVGYGIAIGRKLKALLTPERVSLLIVLSAAIFVAQMLDWPIPGGTSLHFLGGALAGVLLGPLLGFMSLTLVVTVQTLVFHDGGITTLGANLLNMAVIGVLIGYGAFKLTTKLIGDNRASRFLGAFLGGWLSITLAGLACGLEIGLSPSFGFYVDITVPIMVSWHALLGVVEGVITALVVNYVYTKLSMVVYGGGRS
ncbi:MAG: energy-coupling factor ABC transporter permease [Candidatus Nezhaarchaeota archaeon]|nr:energy-coupling factor ABC transporter permease [Candidatus Nezhaarchaeota archaeon]MCX8141207.1 energy-coupling factor ABC transporter permease [Candidatus Nezhaarchaeota archaeon]MDW8049473.1 energy-coupling factor ABC transporter permease [Nitrososphaerota archaeon]